MPIGRCHKHTHTLLFLAHVLERMPQLRDIMKTRNADRLLQRPCARTRFKRKTRTNEGARKQRVSIFDSAGEPARDVSCFCANERDAGRQTEVKQRLVRELSKCEIT